MNDQNGFLVLNKNKGCTSHDCVKQIRRILKIKKVGHAGTLDPEVTGILPIAIGNATRFIQYLPKIKTYFGIIQLGIKTNTDDIHGEIINKKEWPVLSLKELNQYLDHFRGIIQQVPPKVSSVHINGERAYKKSLKNEEFELNSKEVNIMELIVNKWEQDKGLLHIKIKCSAGTYIRSIARDLGKAIGSEGCLFYLERTESSGFNINKSIKIEDLKKKGANIKNFIIPIIKALDHLPGFILDDAQDINFWETGRKIRCIENLIFNKNNPFQNPIKVIDNSNTLLGIGILVKGEISYIQPKLVLNAK